MEEHSVDFHIGKPIFINGTELSNLVIFSRYIIIIIIKMMMLTSS